MNKLKNKLRAIVAIAMTLIVGFNANDTNASFYDNGIYYHDISSFEVEVSYNHDFSGSSIIIPKLVT